MIRIGKAILHRWVKLVSDIDELLEEISDQSQGAIETNCMDRISQPKPTGDDLDDLESSLQHPNSETVTVAKSEYRALIKRLQSAEAQVKQSEEQLQQAVNDLQNMR